LGFFLKVISNFINYQEFRYYDTISNFAGF